jgi:dolichyl-phosphate-mannose--protein O-mannosyl transferase
VCIVLDRDRRAAEDDADRRTVFRARGWRYAAGVAGGAASASKWSGWVIVVALIVLTAAWETQGRRRAGEERAFRRMLQGEGPSILVALVALPIATYMASYIGTIHGAVLAAPWRHGTWWRTFFGVQKVMARFHLSKSPLTGNTNPYISPAWSWPLLKRPMPYFFKAVAGKYREVFAGGSPLVWWSSLLALIYAAVRWIRSRDWSAAEAVIVMGFLAGWVLWLPTSFRRPNTFIHYFLPSVPFMCLAVAWVATRIWRTVPGKTAVAVYLAGAAAVFAFYYPVMTAIPVSPASWDRRILFKDCGPGAPAHPLYPPRPQAPGWCWI